MTDVSPEAWAAVGTVVTAAIAGWTAVRVERVRRGSDRARVAARGAALQAQIAAENTEPIRNGAVPAIHDGVRRIERSMAELAASQGRTIGRLDQVIARIDAIDSAVRRNADGLAEHEREHARSKLEG